MKIVADCDIPYLKGVLEPYTEMVYRKGVEISPADVAEADALIVRTRTRCDRALLQGSRVRMIATATIGFDHIDLDYCRTAGIRVVTAAGCNARGVLQWVAAALALASREQHWIPEERCLGVVGVGHVGSLVAQYAAAWGFRVVCCDPPRQRAGERWGEKLSERMGSGSHEFVSLAEVASQADIVTFHTPLTHTGQDATFHLADSGFFDALRPGALLLNSSRGEVVDTTALLAAVQAGRCSCCIDTWEHEPAIDRDLLSRALVATTHIAGYTAQGKANAASMAVQAVAAEFGFPLTEWYPYDAVSKVEPAAIEWDRMCRTIGSRFDIAAETQALKTTPENFEAIRNGYPYRQEYF